MIPAKFTAASLSDDSMLLSEPGAAAFFTRAQNPETFDVWVSHIRENWIEQPAELFGFERPASESGKDSA